MTDDELRTLFEEFRQRLATMSEQIAAEVIAALRAGRSQPEPLTPSELVRATEARRLLAGRGPLDRVVRAGWLRPVSQSKRLTLFRRKDIEAVAYRISVEGLP